MIRIHKQSPDIFEYPGWVIHNLKGGQMVWGPTLAMALSMWRDWRRGRWNNEPRAN